MSKSFKQILELLKEKSDEKQINVTDEEYNAIEYFGFFGNSLSQPVPEYQIAIRNLQKRLVREKK
jgi:hypothetical protein